MKRVMNKMGEELTEAEIEDMQQVAIILTVQMLLSQIHPMDQPIATVQQVVFLVNLSKMLEMRFVCFAFVMTGK